MKVLIGNFKGPKGDTGSKGDKGDKGNTGATGQRGSRLISGTGITGTSTAGVKFPNSGITDAQLFDHFINAATGNMYECTVPGASSVAEWVYVGNFKGPKGDAGPAGSISDINDQKPTYLEASSLANIESGETIKVAFGKLKKALSFLITHYTQKATTTLLGHVKLSNSVAITTHGEYALDAVEKNASVEGTLANMISQANSNLENKLNIDYRYITFKGLESKGITNYPTEVGIYRITHSLPAGLPADAGAYGALLIFGIGYYIHLYTDLNSNAWIGRSGEGAGDSVATPSVWKKLTS